MDAHQTFLDEYRQAALAAAETKAEEARLEEVRKITFSRLVKDQGDMAVAKAEHIARADAAYEDACDELAAARKAAAIAAARHDYLKTRFEHWRTRAANNRGK